MAFVPTPFVDTHSHTKLKHDATIFDISLLGWASGLSRECWQDLSFAGSEASKDNASPSCGTGSYPPIITADGRASWRHKAPITMTLENTQSHVSKHVRSSLSHQGRTCLELTYSWALWVK
eukprot:5890962-Amphidinium_carterae.1